MNLTRTRRERGGGGRDGGRETETDKKTESSPLYYLLDKFNF